MPRRVLLYTLIMIVIWGSHSPVVTRTISPVAVRTMTGHTAEPLSRHAFLFYKLLLAGACLFVVIVVTGRLRTLLDYSLPEVGKLAFAGVFGYFVYYFLLFWALQRARPQDAVTEVVILNYLFPMCTLLACVAILPERLRVRAVVSAVISFAGAYIVVSGGDFTRGTFGHPFTAVLAVGAAASWGVFSALGRKWRHEPITGIFIFILTGIVISGVILPFTGGRRYPIGWEYYGAFHVGFICNTVGVMLWFLALKHGGASLAGNLSLLASFVNLLFIRLLLPEQGISGWAVVGLVIITLGVVLSRTGRHAPAAAEVTEPPE